MHNLKKTIITFTKAQCSAWVASCIDFVITIILASVLDIWYVYATFLGALSGGIVNCTINYRWVFQPKGAKKKYVALKYIMVWGISILLNTCGTYIMTELTHSNYVISKAIVAAIIAITWNYQMQRLFVFKVKKRNNTLQKLNT